MVKSAEKVRDVVISCLDYPSRHYNCDHVADTYNKKFYPESTNVQLARYADDVLGMYSDSFILYAIAMLGVADIEGIQLFLEHYSAREKKLSIIDCSTKDLLNLRLEALHKSGFIFRHLYRYSFANADNEEGFATAALYTLSNNAHDFMNQRLQKRVLCNNWISAKPISELVGIASCSYVSGMVAKGCSGDVEQKQGIIKTKSLGTYIIPSILKVQDNSSAVYLGFMPSFLIKDEAIMTDADYEDRCVRIVNVIKQFFFSYDRKEKDSAMVVVVENARDLATCTSWISRTKLLEDDYSRIFFTGEGVFSSSASRNIGSHFLQMKKARTAAGYTLVSASLPVAGI